MAAAQLQAVRVTQLCNILSARERDENLDLLALLPELRQRRLHRRSQAFGGAAEVDSWQRPQRVAELVRYHAHLVVTQLQQHAQG